MSKFSEVALQVHSANAKICKIANGWCWDNYKDDDTGEYFTNLQALYNKLMWVDEYLTDVAKVDEDAEEYVDIIKDTMQIVEILQSVFNKD